MMTHTVKIQILAVRDIGETNMFDVHGVMKVAFRNRWYELVNYLSHKENRKEYARFIMTGEVELEDENGDDERHGQRERKLREMQHVLHSFGISPVQGDLSSEEVMDRVNRLFDELVPPEGKAESLAGEIIRAVSRIGCRYYNDGDRLGVGYGKVTCNPAGRFLMDKADESIAEVVKILWGTTFDDIYERMLNLLLSMVASYVETHPELRWQETPDMFEYGNADEDTYDDDDDDEDEDY